MSAGTGIRAIIVVMTIVTGMILSYFILSPVYYTMLDQLNATVYNEADAGSNARGFADSAYGVFYYGLSSLIVLGLLATLAWLYMFMRRKYYSTEEAYYR